jgi:hypothetical protein
MIICDVIVISNICLITSHYYAVVCIVSLHHITTDCAICASGYSGSIGYSCTQCHGGYKAAVVTGIAIVLALVVVLILYLIWELLGLSDGTDATAVLSTCNLTPLYNLVHIPWSKLRTPLVVFQILTQYIGITGLKVPLIYRDFLSWLGALNVDFGWLLSVGCVVQVSFYQKLIIDTLLPFGVALCLCCTYTIAYWRDQRQQQQSQQQQHADTDDTTTTSGTATTTNSNDNSTNNNRSAKLEAILAKHLLIFLTMTFLIYSTVSTVVFQTFACDTLATGDSYLRADYSISCTTTKHKWYRLYSGIMILVYPIGIPVMYAALLWRQRAQLKLDDERSILQRESNASLRKTKFLWETYKPSLFYWEVIECCRRLLLTGTMVFIFPSQTAQPAIASLLAVAAIVLVLWYTPHADIMDTRIYIFGAIIVFLSMFMSLLVKVQDGITTFKGSQTYSATLVSMNILMVIAAIAQLTYVAKRAWIAKASVNKLRRESVRNLRTRLSRSSSTISRTTLFDSESQSTSLSHIAVSTQSDAISATTGTATIAPAFEPSAIEQQQ